MNKKIANMVGITISLAAIVNIVVTIYWFVIDIKMQRRYPLHFLFLLLRISQAPGRANCQNIANIKKGIDFCLHYDIIRA